MQTPGTLLNSAENLRKGLLDEIPHIKINPIRTAIVAGKENSNRITNFLKKYNAAIYTRKIELEGEDIR